MFAEKRLLFMAGGPEGQEAAPPPPEAKKEPESKFYLDGKAQAEVAGKARATLERKDLAAGKRARLEAALAEYDGANLDQSARVNAAEEMARTLEAIARAEAKKPKDVTPAGGIDDTMADKAIADMNAAIGKIEDAPNPLVSASVDTAALDAAAIREGHIVVVPGEGIASTAQELAQKEADSKAKKGQTRVASGETGRKPTA